MNIVVVMGEGLRAMARRLFGPGRRHLELGLRLALNVCVLIRISHK